MILTNIEIRILYNNSFLMYLGKGWQESQDFKPQSCSFMVAVWNFEQDNLKIFLCWRWMINILPVALLLSDKGSSVMGNVSITWHEGCGPS